MAAEDVLHDLGAISMIGADSTGMGRVGESVRRTFQLAHLMKERAGEGAEVRDDNERILRYLAKVTINPAIAHGIDGYVGSLEPGKHADVVLWWPGLFGVKPAVVLKDGFMITADAGHGNGSTIDGRAHDAPSVVRSLRRCAAHGSGTSSSPRRRWRTGR